MSPDAKDFIRACLIYRKEDRADIFTLASHSYLKEKGFILSFDADLVFILFYTIKTQYKPTIRRSASNKVININENSN